MDCSMCKFYYNELDEEPCVSCSNNYTCRFQPISISHKLDSLLKEIGKCHCDSMKVVNVSAVIEDNWTLEDVKRYAKDTELDYSFDEILNAITIKDRNGIRYSFTKLRG